MAELLFAFLFACLSKMENSREGVLLSPWVRTQGRDALPPMLPMQLALCSLAVSPGLWKFTSDKYILLLSLLGIGMPESHGVIPSVPGARIASYLATTVTFSA